ncbi:MAG TPA: hypothetical protein VMH22_12460 [bacterium]|nr:hypothetical protein [bacterium]
MARKVARSQKPESISFAAEMKRLSRGVSAKPDVPVLTPEMMTYEDFVELFRPGVVAIIRYRRGDLVDPEARVDDAFLYLYPKWDTYYYCHLDKAGSHLYTKAIQKATDEWRKLQREKTDSLESLSVFKEPSIEGPAPEWARKVKADLIKLWRSRLWDMLNGIPRLQRFAVILFCLKGRNYNYIVRKLGLRTKRQARYAVFSGLVMLAVRLKEVRPPEAPK